MDGFDLFESESEEPPKEIDGKPVMAMEITKDISDAINKLGLGATLGSGQPVRLEREEAIKVAEKLGIDMTSEQAKAFFKLDDKEVEQMKDNKAVEEEHSEPEYWDFGL